MFTRSLSTACLLSFLGNAGWAAEYTFIGPGFSAFDYTFTDFQQEPTSDGVRLYDLQDDSGGAGISLRGADLSAYGGGRLVADFATLPTNSADFFVVELVDTNGNQRKWDFLSSAGGAGQPQRVVARGTLDSDAANVNGATEFDLTSVARMQVLGTYSNPVPFDVDLRSLVISSAEPPPAPYVGYEPDAAWRTEAAGRIDSIRKADLNVRVVDAAGRGLPGASIHVNQTEHAFRFGAAVQARRIDSDLPENLVYQQRFAELFNAAVLENAMKWIAYEGDWGPDFAPARADAAVSWLRQNGVDVRGHNLVWPGERWLPSSIKSVVESAPLDATQQQWLRDQIAAHISEIATRYAGELSSWDVVNESRRERAIMEALDEGDDAMIAWFNEAANADPAAKLYLNDYGILDSDGAINSPNQRLLLEQAEALRSGGAPIDGVGVQAHFKDSDLTGPEQLWRIIDRYADAGFDVQVTEFDHQTTDESLQADYLRDFLTAAFAHEGVSQITQWGFWEDAHWRPEAALFRSDWSIKPNGQAYLDLVYDKWWTDEQAEAGDEGELIVRAFKGEHLVEAGFGGVEASVDTTLVEDATLTITLDLLSGDFNRDGSVDAADYTAWRDTLGQTVAQAGLGADADGDRTITLSDLAVWQANYGATLPNAAPAPEPTAFVLGMIAAGCVTLRSGHASKRLQG